MSTGERQGRRTAFRGLEQRRGGRVEIGCQPSQHLLDEEDLHVRPRRRLVGTCVQPPRARRVLAHHDLRRLGGGERARANAGGGGIHALEDRAQRGIQLRRQGAASLQPRARRIVDRLGVVVEQQHDVQPRELLQRHGPERHPHEVGILAPRRQQRRQQGLVVGEVLIDRDAAGVAMRRETRERARPREQIHAGRESECGHRDEEHGCGQQLGGVDERTAAREGDDHRGEVEHPQHHAGDQCDPRPRDAGCGRARVRGGLRGRVAIGAALSATGAGDGSV